MACPIPVIAGPTAVGKTDISLRLAAAFGAEIIGGDSRQVYRFLDIGTAKPSPAQRRLVRHHLIDILNPDEPLNAARYAQLARGCINACAAHGRPVFIVGGSGLYLRALTDGLFTGPAANPHLRAALETEVDQEGLQVLHDRLATVDPTAASRIHPHDRVRIIRALEIYTLTGTPISQWQCQWQQPIQAGSFVLIGLRRTPEDLRQRIAARTEAMLQMGLEAEVRKVLAMGYAPTSPPLQSVGYREILAYIDGHYDLARAHDLIERHTWHLAKRQMTWFRHLVGMHWISLTDTTEAAALQAIRHIVRATWAEARESLTDPRQDCTSAACTCPQES